MKDKKYQKRKTCELRLSSRQLEQMSALHAISVFMDTNKLNEIPDINTQWLEIWRKKRYGLHEGQLERLKKQGIYDVGRLKIRKTKKGYVIEQIYSWRSKGIRSITIICGYCKKSKLVNIFGVCKKCEKLLKSKRKYQKFLSGGLE